MKDAFVMVNGERFDVEANALDLHGLDITDIFEIEGLEALTDLKELDLHINQLSEISGLESLCKLEILNLSANTIEEIKGLEKLTNLRVLELQATHVTEIKGLNRLRKLERLNLMQNEIIEIKGLGNLKNLIQLDLWQDDISQIQGLDNLANLLFLNLSSNHIEEINGLGGLEQLKRLYLFNNQITQLKGLENLRNLEVLDLSGNPIKSEELGFLKERPSIIVLYCKTKSGNYSWGKGLSWEEILQQIRHFSAIYQELSFERLSEQLGFSQTEVADLIEYLLLKKAILGKISKDKLIFGEYTGSDIQSLMALLWQFERDLREFLEAVLSRYFENWWDEGIPKHFRDRAVKKEENQRQEDRKKGVPERAYKKIEFLEFANYADIITEGYNWEKIFSNYFPEKKYLQTYFKDLTDIRNSIDHGRQVSPDTVSAGKQLIKRLSNLIQKAAQL